MVVFVITVAMIVALVEKLVVMIVVVAAVVDPVMISGVLLNIENDGIGPFVVVADEILVPAVVVSMVVIRAVGAEVLTRNTASNVDGRELVVIIVIAFDEVFSEVTMVAAALLSCPVVSTILLFLRASLTRWL